MKTNFKEFLAKIDYKDPSEYDFDSDDKIDNNIKETIKNINKSSWCWTLWSCEGHIHSDSEKSLPYKYAIMNVHWSDLFLEEEESHAKLLSDIYDMIFKILEAKL